MKKYTVNAVKIVYCSCEVMATSKKEAIKMVRDNPTKLDAYHHEYKDFEIGENIEL